MKAVGVTTHCFEPGVTLLGQYRIEKVVGRGAMGLVVAAWDTELHQHVAIKLLLGMTLTESEPAERFMREARIAVKLKSDHVVRVMNAGSLESGTPYMVMELLEGRDLGSDGPLPTQTAVDYVLQAIDAIAEAHTHRIVHRDLKPSNLFLATRAGASPIIKVLDFGISKMTGLEGDPSLTNAESIMGSPRYMPPEQFRSAKQVDGRSDVWALGAILYTLLRGAPPFDGASIAEVFEAVLQREPSPLRAPRREIPPELEGVVLRCLRKKPENRFANVAELAQALAPFGTGEWQRCVVRANKLLAGKTIVFASSLTPSEAFAPPGKSSSPSLPFDATQALDDETETGLWGLGGSHSRLSRQLGLAKRAPVALFAGIGATLSLLVLATAPGLGSSRASESQFHNRFQNGEDISVALATSSPVSPSSEKAPTEMPSVVTPPSEAEKDVEKPLETPNISANLAKGRTVKAKGLRAASTSTPKPAPKASGTIFDDRH